MSIYHIFVYLQLLDLLTTLVGFRMGASEASPFIRMLMHVGPAVGVVASKVLALGIGAVCVAVHKGHLIRWISYWYGGGVLLEPVVWVGGPRGEPTPHQKPG